MTIVFPPDLLQPLRQGYRYQAGEARRFAAQDAGPERIALRISNTPDVVGMTLDLTADEAAAFWNFWRDDTRRGLYAFVIPDPEVDGWSWLYDDGTPVLCEDDEPALLSAHWVAMFGRAVPQSTPLGVRKRISFDLLVMTP